MIHDLGLMYGKWNAVLVDVIFLLKYLIILMAPMKYSIVLYVGVNLKEMHPHLDQKQRNKII